MTTPQTMTTSHADKDSLERERAHASEMLFTIALAASLLAAVGLSAAMLLKGVHRPAPMAAWSIAALLGGAHFAARGVYRAVVAVAIVGVVLLSVLARTAG